MQSAAYGSGFLCFTFATMYVTHHWLQLCSDHTVSALRATALPLHKSPQKASAPALQRSTTRAKMRAQSKNKGAAQQGRLQKTPREPLIPWAWALGEK